MSDNGNQKFGIDKTMMPESETDPKATTGPGHVHLSEKQIEGLEKPKSKEELQELTASMNK
ncbi:protein of unknown function [Taphrina deformans PYCC 5710]|uniref:Uncharacterized protein n=1 Tax=Taphrina deformans (strain PYCC 5710 / ATCC 11124 / CBS 356.35 / IMI 108563 / JCM 9778 / NBRC 8474) TaxID=1097556 RepID=R4X773_TAPDE|nr:protein of unknown function [Taphrina deformans PYCC 5710]|eukprot:CCG81152.1 protein of unknown function [Taphrina deformans PYCC 5710]